MVFADSVKVMRFTNQVNKIVVFHVEFLKHIMDGNVYVKKGTI